MINNSLNTQQYGPTLQEMHAAHSDFLEIRQNVPAVNFLQQSASFLGLKLSQEELLRRYLQH